MQTITTYQSIKHSAPPKNTHTNNTHMPSNNQTQMFCMPLPPTHLFYPQLMHHYHTSPTLLHSNLNCGPKPQSSHPHPVSAGQTEANTDRSNCKKSNQMGRKGEKGKPYRGLHKSSVTWKGDISERASLLINMHVQREKKTVSSPDLLPWLIGWALLPSCSVGKARELASP